ncbi:6-phosphogluconolactonase [Actinorugispora endophytica]|uniref:6-phosphogluconolactonase n=1 Tax=Actinorugispora endophytica TaxID=1605990 RepID=A0A4R6UN08_9ACTN|nr:6-phosphogluconolactonase [Actinorugispora endophytica]TDQ47586.1 6-phosphogluconolactonase [Actinorugispora endophytica]
MSKVVNPPTVVVQSDADLLAKATAARIVTRLVDAQALRGTASVVLTGGGIGIAVLSELAKAPARDAIDWRRVDVWWGDERFLPAGDPERNETQARAALLDHVPVPAERVHVMPAPGGPDGDDPEAGARRYAEELRAAAGGGADAPPFDVCLLGVGPDAHVASLFPELPAMYETERTVVAVHGSPKPPPVRVSLTLPAIRGSREVWLLAAGESKADAVHLALGKAGPVQVPAAGARGRSRTLFLLDHAAASALPPGLYVPGH